MQVIVSSEIAGADRDECWRLYHAAFAETQALAVQRHLMYRNEFDEVMTDSRVAKYRAVDRDDVLVGLVTTTTALDAMPLIAPEYFEARWPELYEQRRIFYVGFAATRPGRRWTTALATLTQIVGKEVAEVGGLLVLDMSRDRTQRRLPEFVLAKFHGVAGDQVRITALDEQVYYAYEFSPTPDGSTTPSRISLEEELAPVTSAGHERLASAGGAGLP